MEELSESTSWMKKVVIGLVALIIVIGVAVTVFGSSSQEGECSTETEAVTPADMDAEASPF